MLLHLVKFVIVSGKESTSPYPTMLVKILYDSPGNRDTIVCRGTTTKLVKEHERVVCGIIEDICSLSHFHHKGRFSNSKVIRSTHTSEYLIHYAYFRALCWHIASYLGHQHYQGGLTQQSRFTSHVRAGDDYYLR